VHIPDGFLDPVTAGVTYLVSIAYAVYAFRRLRAEKGRVERRRGESSSRRWQPGSSPPRC